MARISVQFDDRPIERSVVPDAEMDAEVRRLFAQPGAVVATGRADNRVQLMLQREGGGIVREGRYSPDPDGWECRECGHHEVQRFTRCIQCGGSDMIAPASVGWTWRVIE